MTLNRRDFVKRAAAGAGAVMIGEKHLLKLLLHLQFYRVKMTEL